MHYFAPNLALVTLQKMLQVPWMILYQTTLYCFHVKKQGIYLEIPAKLYYLVRWYNLSW